ncbi:MAG: riboflavin synthase [Halofilum sp. (in: g-proteobacteria)]
MFTGLVEAVGRVAAVEPQQGDCRVRIEPGAFAAELQAGESIAVSGACLTVTEPDASGFWADVSGETLAHTTLGERCVGDGVNLERALAPTTRLGGHFVAGHVDGVGEITARTREGRSVRFSVRVPDALARYVAPKGSICVDGVSLTVNEVDGSVFGVNIIPHTLACTTLDALEPGTRVNIEADLVARYLERLVAADQD